MDLSNRPVLSYSKETQTRGKRIKPRQRTLGAISPQVRQEVRERSKGICEVRERCKGARAVEQAHIRGRRRMEHRTSAADLRDSCKECHAWLDSTGPGAVHKRKLREEQAQ